MAWKTTDARSVQPFKLSRESCSNDLISRSDLSIGCEFIYEHISLI